MIIANSVSQAIDSVEQGGRALRLRRRKPKRRDAPPGPVVGADLYDQDMQRLLQTTERLGLADGKALILQQGTLRQHLRIPASHVDRARQLAEQTLLAT